MCDPVSQTAHKNDFEIHAKMWLRYIGMYTLWQIQTTIKVKNTSFWYTHIEQIYSKTYKRIPRATLICEVAKRPGKSWQMAASSISTVLCCRSVVSMAVVCGFGLVDKTHWVLITWIYGILKIQPLSAHDVN